MTTEQKQERMIDKLRKVLALTNSPVEGEAQAAALTLKRLLLEHNLSMADLEKTGFAAPGIAEMGHDLAKAAFAWKLELAEMIADHYFCYGVVNRTTKTVVFVGRPDNVEALKELYAWIIEQIRNIASDERKAHIQHGGEHIDPLRWQLNFGLGAVQRLAVRLEELRAAQVDNATTALVLHHKTEISDYLEKEHGYRVDGKRTVRQQKWADEVAEQKKADEELLASDPVAYYNRYPWRHPDEVAKANAEYEKKARRRQGRTHKVRHMNDAEYKQYKQAGVASEAGRRAADRIEIQRKVGGE